MSKAVIYARYSSHKQHETSIDDQIRVCKDEAAKRGDTIVGIYADKAISGRKTRNRTEFQRMIANAKYHLWDAIYVYKLDRFARDRHDAAVFRKKLKDEGVTLISATEPMVEGPESVILESMLEGLAEYYSLVMGANIKRGMEGNALRCHHNGVTLYGYDLGRDGRYIVNDAEASIVREAFERYAAGESVNDIAAEFYRYRTRQGKQWTVQKIVKILHQEKYAGTYMFGPIRIPDGMPAIVSHELYDEVNAKMNGTRGRNHEFPLTGLLFDAQGRSFGGTSGTGKRGKRYYYYMVRGTSKRYPQDVVEANVYGAVSDFVQSPDVADRVVEGILAAQDEVYADDDTAAEALRARLAEIARESANLLKLAMKMGPTDQITAQMGELEDERTRIELELVDAQTKAPRLTEDMVRCFVAKIVSCEAPTAVVSAFVDRIVLDGNQMTVTFGLGCSDVPRALDDGGKHPSEPADQEGCSRTYSLVAQPIPKANPDARTLWLLIGLGFFGFVTTFDRSRP